MEVDMGLLDELGTSLKGLLGSATSAEAPALLSAMLAKTSFGNLQGLIDQLQQSGLGDQVKSWLSNGPNMKITPDQLHGALQSDQVKQIAEHFGVPVDQALKTLADYLPGVVDEASPNGTIEKL
jgi:uncharacterized protein YidB (DUF937 family)